MFYLGLLGGATIEDESGRVTGLASRRHPVALLALLASAPSYTLSRGKLVGLLWPKSPEETARNRLATYVHLIRSELGDDVLASVGDELRLDRDLLACDVCRFQEAVAAGEHERAVELYVGPFMDGFSLGGSQGFEEWMDHERERLQRDYRGALESLAEAAEERGEAKVAAEWWRRRADEDPYDSRVTRRLMEALAKADNRAAALRIAEAHSRLLEEEFGTEPSAEFHVLVEELQEAPARQVTESDTAEQVGPAAQAKSDDGARKQPQEAVEALIGQSNTRRTEAERARRPFTWRSAVPVALLAIAFLAVVATGLYLLYGGAAAEESAVGGQRLAVLPFESLSPDPENDYFTAGVHDEVITQLSRVDGLGVIARTSVMGYKGRPADVRAIADELDVTSVLEGTVRKSSDRVRITVQLIDAGSNEHLWSETFDRELTVADIFDIQTEIAARVSNALRAELTPEEERRIRTPPTENPEAYEYYLRARVAPGLDTTTALLERAVQLDPSFAAAWAKLARTRIGMSWGRLDMDLRQRGIEALERAVDLAPDAFETYLARALYQRLITQDLDQALEQLRLAEELQPNNTDLFLARATALRFAGRWDESLATLERAAELDPLNAGVAANLAHAHRWLGDFAQAERYYDRAIALDPSDPRHYQAKFSFLQFSLADTTKMREFLREHPEKLEWRPGWLEYVRRDYEKARDSFLSQGNWFAVGKVSHVMNERERIRSQADSVRIEWETRLSEAIESEGTATRIAWQHIFLGQLDALLGDGEAAVRHAEKALDTYRVSVDAVNYAGLLSLVAHIYVMIGDDDRAIDLLEESLSIPGPMSAAWFHLDPSFDPLRDHPRFQALLDRSM